MLFLVSESRARRAFTARYSEPPSSTKSRNGPYTSPHVSVGTFTERSGPWPPSGGPSSDEQSTSELEIASSHEKTRAATRRW